VGCKSAQRRCLQLQPVEFCHPVRRVVFSAERDVAARIVGVAVNPPSPLESPSNILRFVIENNDAGERVDRFLARSVPQLSRTRIQELIDAGLVTVRGAATKGSRKLRIGEDIRVEVQARAPMVAEAEAIPLDILYEDDDVLVVNKPAGMTVHAGAGNPRGTLVNALLGRGQELSSGGDALRPGIVHRLDKETSGAILVAKNDFAHARLAHAFAQRTVTKTYIALVEGILQEKQGRIELAIGRDLQRRTRMAAVREKGKPAALRASARPARTDWRALAVVDGTTLVEAQLHTGRTHQIRVHFSALGHPVVGDTLYGAADQLTIAATGIVRDTRSRHVHRRDEAQRMPVLGRNFLHAARLGFARPRTGAWVDVRAPLPTELTNYLRLLASESGEDWAGIDAALAGFL
jgi:23S rRNA pseudouridine1911/1915/1917 synthase